MKCFTYHLECIYHGKIRHVVGILLLLLATLAGLAMGKDNIFTGEIMDKMCAHTNSHHTIMKSEGASNAKDCTLKCVKDGGSFALYDPAIDRTIANINVRSPHVSLYYAGKD